MDSTNAYLQPTRLCDFDRAHEIGKVAAKLTEDLVDKRQIFHRIYQLVREFPYGLEDWDIKASETLHKKWGMCSGKTNLLVAMSRCLGIPARYRIMRIRSEGALWRWIATQDSKLARQMGEPIPEQDHVAAEVYLDGWEAYDPSRDLAFEEGLKRLGIPLERKLVIHASDIPRLVRLASFDEWAQNRQRARRFREDRQPLFARMNEHIDEIRHLGRR